MTKKLFNSIFLMLVVTGVQAQGVSKLFGLVGGSPQANQSSNGFLFSTDSSGNNLQVQYQFPVTVFGASPANLEMMPYNGKLYGTTSRGGVYNYGTIFEYDPVTNTYTKKFDFGPNVAATGGSPKGSLLLYNNKFYGLAADYGINGGGALFEWDPATNVYTKKFDFNGNGTYPGNAPQNSLRLMNGKMYGTTQQGGASNLGVVFEWDPVTNTAVKLFELNGPNGWGFYNNVTPYNNKLYCISHQGGTNGYGALYVIDPALPYGSNTTIIKQLDFAGGGTGNNCEMIVYNNKLYGTMYQGGSDFSGTLFELDPATNTFTKLVDFVYNTSGRGPMGKLVQNGSKFLGLCSSGGTNGTGTIYEWDPANPTVLTNKASFKANTYSEALNPGSTLAYANSKFYGVTFNGGFVNQGNLFEYDYTTNTLTTKLNFNAAENGRIPYGKPVLLDGKLYGTCYQGPQEIFGTPYGCLWSFDPSTSVYSRKFLFDNVNNAANGRAPISSPIAFNGKLYGTTSNGGTSDYGLLYEYDPITNGYIKKDMQPIGGAFPIGEPTLYNNKLYGLTNANGAGNYGIIYSYDPATGILAKTYDVQNSGGRIPVGGFSVYNNKLYFATSGGGTNNSGAIVAYDPATNTSTVVYDLLGGIQGQGINNAMTLYDNKFYGATVAGGSFGRGTIFRFDPVANTYTVLYNFSTATGGTGIDPRGELTISGNKLYLITQESNVITKVLEFDPVTNAVTVKSEYTGNNLNVPSTHNGLTVVPAFIANGNPGGCETYPVVNINPTNNNKWMPILNTAGDVVAEIKANGNNLGDVTASTFINNGTVRENEEKQLYLDRNITINVQNPPSGNVDIRLYIKTSEYLRLKNALNSMGQPSGITSINDIIILKNPENCPVTMGTKPTRVNTLTSNYEYGYVLAGSINSFSTFFFGRDNFVVLPITLLSFNAVKNNATVLVNWKTATEVNLLGYEVERSTDGSVFKTFTTAAPKTNGSNAYTVTDSDPVIGSNYYRLKSIDRDGRIAYSNIVRVDFDNNQIVSIWPNPAHDHITIKGADNYMQIQVMDVNGKIVVQFNRTADNRYSIAGLASGMYVVRLVGSDKTVTQKIIVE